MSRAVIGVGKAGDVLPSGLVVAVAQGVALVASVLVASAAHGSSAWWRTVAAAVIAGAGLGFQQRNGKASGDGVLWSARTAAVVAALAAGLIVLFTVHARGGLAVLAIVLVVVPAAMSAIGALTRLPAGVRDALTGAEVERHAQMETAAATLGTLVVLSVIGGLAQAAGLLRSMSLLWVAAVAALAWWVWGSAIRRRRY
jgi:hypothetical protein